MDYKDKIVLITGASSDIGKSMAKFFAQRKASLILTYYHNDELVKKLKDKLIAKYAVNVDIVYLDLCQENVISNVYNYVNDKYQKIDILVNNAALSIDSFIMDKNKQEFMQVLETNVVGTFLMMKYFDNLINHGYIFNMSSTDGIDTGNIYSIDYNVSKAGINTLTKTFSLYSDNVIISLCPNWVDTKSTNSMDKNYLDSELKRVHQNKLISPILIAQVIDKCIKEKVKSGSIIRIEGEEDVRRIN